MIINNGFPTRETNEYVDFWNDTLAVKFERFRKILMNGLSYHGDVPLQTLELAPGSRVLDIACGWGDTARALGHKTGPDGEVLGLDCVEQFLDKGRRDARAEGLDHVHFEAADVEVYPFERKYDFAFSRFGIMYMQNPVAAMRNVRKALKLGGRLLFTAWRVIEDNEWLGLPKDVILRYLPPPGENALSCGPGPFSMANTETVTKQLEIAGYEAIDFQRTDGPVIVGDSLNEGIEFQLAIGPAGEIFREAGDEAIARCDDIHAALGNALAPYLKGGQLVMPSSSWAFSATNPG